jgi:signal transduction histidine kinase
MHPVPTKPAPAPLPIDEALATLAHELRNPLNTILLALDLHSGDGDPAARRALTMAAHQARRAVRIIDDLFDLCAGSRGRLSLRKEVVQLAAVVTTAAATTAHLLAARGHRLTVSLPAGPVFLVADPCRLEQVLTNLLANAAKFTDPGGTIGLTVEREGAQAVVRVRDNGSGMKPELVPRVFDPFTQGERTPERSHGGLGLGLTLVKRLVEMHGGTVEARSEGPGKGSEFTVRLRVLPAEAEEPQAVRANCPSSSGAPPA